MNKSKKLSLGINIGAVILSVLVLLLPEEASFYIALISPPLLYILLLCFHRMFYNAYAKNALQKVPKRELAGKAPLPLLGIAIFLLVLATRPQLANLEGRWLYEITFGVTAVLSAVVFLVHRRKMFVSSVIGIIVMILVGVYGEMFTVNSVALHEFERYRAKVAGKYTSGIPRLFARGHYYCKVRTPKGNEIYYEVAGSLYNQVKEGDEVVVITGSSALGFTVTQVYLE